MLWMRPVRPYRGVRHGEGKETGKKNSRTRLDKRHKKDIITLVYIPKAMTKPALRNRPEREGRR